MLSRLEHNDENCVENQCTSGSTMIGMKPSRKTKPTVESAPDCPDQSVIFAITNTSFDFPARGTKNGTHVATHHVRAMLSKSPPVHVYPGV